MVEKKDKKKLIILSCIAIVVLLLMVGISYAFWQTTKVQEDTNIISSGCFGVQFEGDNPISLTNSFPVTDENGMKTTPYTFTITNTCNGKAVYDLNLEALSTTTILNTSVRVALDDSHKLYSEYSEAEKYYDDSKESRKLVSGILEAKESVTYKLRIWVDEKVMLEEQNKTFASKIVINANEYFDAPEITDLNATSTINSIKVTYNANGDISNTCKWGTIEGTYDNEVVDATNTNCDITGLAENTTYYYQICTETGKGNKCVEGMIKTNLPISIVKVGDYISMTPTSTSYTIPTSLTGYTASQTINPSELNLWRVIRKNSDGTVDVVSEYVSSDVVVFSNRTGYLNIVGGLNTIATQYTNDKYVQRTRHMGNNNQKEFCTSVSSCPVDTGYSTDVNLVRQVFGTLVGMKKRDNKVNYYYLASRGHNQGDTSLSVNYIKESGEIGLAALISGSYIGTPYGSIRPILTLKSDIQITSGDGSSAETAYAFE